MLKTKRVKIGNREYEIQELSGWGSLQLYGKEGNEQTLALLQTCVISPKITEEFLKKEISGKELNELISEINKINGWEKDFQSAKS